ncbi:MAG: ImmA/IrrE family metallo-endopeptidase [Clostridia bacterium]|nr:ImmA/IrrE family metallo-endopeptidase [Clostridia bacterium]
MASSAKPNFSAAYSKANEILVKSLVISMFPFSPIELVKEQSAIMCRTYKKAQKYGIDITAFGSDSATIFECDGRQIIFYDDSKVMTHVKYSILHELGHSLINHDFSVNDKETYGQYEVETNYFAAQLLMPEQVLREFAKRGARITKEFLMEHFEVSETAAKKRIETLAKTTAEWRSRQEKEFDDIILCKFSAFINSTCPYSNDYFDFEDEYERQRTRDSWF